MKKAKDAVADAHPPLVGVFWKHHEGFCCLSLGTSVGLDSRMYWFRRSEFTVTYYILKFNIAKRLPIWCCYLNITDIKNFLDFSVFHFEMLSHVFTSLDSTPACRKFLRGSRRTWPTVMLQAAASWRTVILIMTIFGMTTHRGLYSQQVRLIRQAGLPRLFWQI